MAKDSKRLRFIKDLVWSLLFIGGFVAVGIAITGCWPFMVAVESGSMMPNLMPGDVVILFSPSRVGLVTWEEGEKIGYMSFGDYGDVIVYKPNGHGKPIIHRVITYVKKGEKIPAKVGGELALTDEVARGDGYITQGDNKMTNRLPDQCVPAPYSPINERIYPVKEEWVIGVAKFRIPIIGYFRLLLPI